MENYTSVLLNTALIVSSIIMGLVFLVIPIPKKKSLKNYRNSLRFLALAYISLAGLSIPYIFESYTSNTQIDLIATSFETILFSFTVITLFNPKFASKLLIFKHILPTLVYITLLIAFYLFWGETNNTSKFTDLNVYKYPTEILNAIFLLFCIAQILYFTNIFRSEVKKYELKIDDFYSETYSLKLKWVRYCFYSALAFSLLIITSIIFSSTEFCIIVTAINITFNTVFGLNYIQYPNTYNKIEAALSDQEDSPPRKNKTSKKKTWEEIKEQIISEKQYLRQGINIEELAHYLKIGRTTLSTYINIEEKMNFNTWINYLKIEESKILLINNPEHNFTQIAEMIGYTESSNFSRQFKLITGETPSNWRQNYTK